MSEPLHSALYFGETRDYWWHADYLALITQRMGLSRAQRVLDVGAGVGHWGRAVVRALPAGSHITGIDREPAWVEAATQRAAELGASERFSYRVAEAQRLPFADESFDLVTCQTLLIHLPEPRVVLAEMRRVLAPGGQVLLVEPNNIANTMASWTGLDMDVERVLRVVRFQMQCELGKARLGLGFNSLGEELPGLLREVGLTLRFVCQNERASPLVPPYDSDSQRADVAERKSFVEQGIFAWPREEARRYFEGYGKTRDEFEREYDFCLECERERVAKIERGELALAGGSVQYLFVARKA